MPRQVTKGPNIQMRLPVDLHGWVEERAMEHEESVSSYLSRNLIRLLERQREAETRR